MVGAYGACMFNFFFFNWSLGAFIPIQIITKPSLAPNPYPSILLASSSST